MKRMIGKSAANAALFLALAACNGSKENKIITPQGVGSVTFDQAIPDMGKGYAVESDTAYYDSPEGFPFYVIKDKAGNRVAHVFAGEAIEVFSPEFSTESGIHPGMNLYEAAQITGEENLFIWLGWPNNYFSVEDATTRITWSIPGDQMNGGWDAFERYSMEGNGNLKLSDFSPEAVIGSISVVNQ